MDDHARAPLLSPTRRLLIVGIVGLLASGVGAVALRSDGSEPPIVRVAVDDPGLRTPPTTIASTTTTATATALPAPAPKAVVVPKNPYAAEQIVEIGTIEIPKIGLSHRIFHGITLRNIDHGPSHWPGTAFPGENGNTVFAGHRVTHSKPFRNIDQLVPGDQIIFTVNGVRSVYSVTGSEIVTPKALHIADPTATPTATLFACHPPGSAKQRYVVRAALLAA